MEFLVRITAKASKSFLFKIDLIMEGAFIGKKDVLQMEQFEEMLEINGVVTLSQISRSFLLSVTSQSGIKPPVRMPMINVVALRDKIRKNRPNRAGVLASVVLRSGAGPFGFGLNLLLKR